MDFNPRVEFAHRMALISDDIYKSAVENFGGDYMNTAKANSLCLNSLQRYEERLQFSFSGLLWLHACIAAT
ncbi:hypothetical protein Tco_0915131 [Tanacetum coccineum]